MAIDDPQNLPFLLVDAEAPVSASSPWTHVKARPGDGWTKPADATDDHLHLMVQCMESWLIADRNAVSGFYGQGFKATVLAAPGTLIETVAKQDVLTKLGQATKGTKTKGPYSKGAHSFDLLKSLDAKLLCKASPWADRFFSTLQQRLP